MAFMIRRVKRLPIPVQAVDVSGLLREWEETHVGKKRLTIIPALHGVFGKSLIIGARVIKVSKQM